MHSVLFMYEDVFLARHHYTVLAAMGHHYVHCHSTCGPGQPAQDCVLHTRDEGLSAYTPLHSLRVKAEAWMA